MTTAPDWRSSWRAFVARLATRARTVGAPLPAGATDLLAWCEGRLEEGERVYGVSTFLLPPARIRQGWIEEQLDSVNYGMMHAHVVPASLDACADLALASLGTAQAVAALGRMGT